MDYQQINKNSIKIIEALIEGKAYFNEIYEKTEIKSKNNLSKNLNSLTINKILIKEEKKANTYYSINYTNKISIAILSLINKTKFEKLPFNVKKGIFDCLLLIKPRIGILFGSFSKNNYGKESDIDLLFFDGLIEQKEKIKEISKNYGIKISPTFMKFKEFNLKSESLKHIFKSGYPLIGEEYFYNEYKEI